MTMRIADQDSINLRFRVGTRVECNTGPWVPGTVVRQFYSQKSFPEGKCVPYQVKLDDGRLIFAPTDDDRVVRRIVEIEFEMHDAVASGDIITMNRILNEDTELYCLAALDENGQCVMHIAVDYAIAEPIHGMALMRALLSAGKGTRDSPQAIALSLALLERSTTDGMTALHRAASLGSSELFTELLSTFPDEILPDIINRKTKLQGGLYNGQWGKKKDDKIEKLDSNHKSLLHLAIDRLIILDDDDDDDDDDGDRLVIAKIGLDDAGCADVIELVRTLIGSGIDVNARDADGRAPIHQAVGAGLHDVAQLLLDAQADPTIGGKAIGKQNNALHQATLRDDAQMIRLLLSAAALNVGSAGQGGWTALALAARSGHEAAAKALLEGGADPTAVMANGKSALDIARVNNKVGIIALLTNA